MSLKSKRFLYSLLILLALTVMVFYLDSLEYTVSGRTFEDLAPLIYMPLIIIFFVMMLVGTYRRGRK